jgi:hypothetical protein
MLSGCVGITVCYANPVIVNDCVMLSWVCGNHGVLFLASGWESRCECRASGCESWWIILSQWLWITMCYSVPVGVNHGELCWGSGFASCCAIMCQYVCLMVSFAQQVVVNHSVLLCASKCDSWWVMLNHWLWIIVSFDEPVVVHHFEI